MVAVWGGGEGHLLKSQHAHHMPLIHVGKGHILFNIQIQARRTFTIFYEILYFLDLLTLTTYQLLLSSIVNCSFGYGFVCRTNA